MKNGQLIGGERTNVTIAKMTSYTSTSSYLTAWPSGLEQGLFKGETQDDKWHWLYHFLPICLREIQPFDNLRVFDQ
jgi:hypothetical protein